MRKFQASKFHRLAPQKNQFFPWNPDFNTGIALIDQQHQELIYLVNKVAHLFAESSKPHIIEQVLNELSDYAVYHFQSEENIWTRFLPETEETLKHQQIHQDFIDYIISIREEKNLFDEKVIREFLSFLVHWLSFHILDTDRNMAHMVLAVQAGRSIADARTMVSHEAQKTKQLFMTTLLKMYDSISSKNLQLMREIGKRQQAEERLRLFKSAIDTSLEAIFITDHHGMLVDANPAFCARVHKTWEELSDFNIRQLNPTLFDAQNIREAWKYTNKYGHWAGEILSNSSEGMQETAWLSLSAITNNDGMISHYAGVFSTASSLIEQNRFLETEVNYDALTRLPNRRLFHEHLKQAIANSERKNTRFALCFLDLDGFKSVNDSFGHDVGDRLLCAVSKQIEQALRKTDSVARMGGDEFAILLTELNATEEVKPILLKVLEHIQRPISIALHRLRVSASMGVAIYPDDSLNPDDLLKKADTAMYRAKHSGKSRINFYHNEENICAK